MKKLVLCALMLLLVLPLFAGGRQEKEQSVYKLTLVNNGKGPWPEGYDSKGYSTPWDKLLADFAVANPDIDLTLVIRDVSQGSMTVDALMAKGTPPDVWWDAAAYFPKYLNAGYALPLEKYIDTSKWQKDLVDLYSRDGHVYGLPAMNVVAALVINTDMLKEVGYTMPAQPDWTIDEFLVVAEKLKAKGYPATILMTKSGMIGWMLPWFYSFGAQMYKDGDHSKVAINSPEAVKALEFLKMLVDKGYAMPHPNELTDDDGVEYFTTAKVFSCMMQNGHVDGWVPEQVKQGKIPGPFNYDFVEFPHVAGQAHTPVAGYQSIAVAHNSGDEAKNKAIAKVVEMAAGPVLQEFVAMSGGGFPSYVGLDLPARGAMGKESTRNLMKLASTAGLMDLASLEPWAREVGRAWITPTHEFFDGKISAKEMLNRFEAEANKVIQAAK